MTGKELFARMEFSTPVAPRFFNTGGVAIRGVDPIGYFREGRPVAGDPAITSDYLGFTFRHASADNAALFRSNPEKYAPQFGGYCAFAMSKGAVATTIPQAWNVENVATAPPDYAIHGDLLYLNYSLPVRDAWRADMAGNVTRAHSFWPEALRNYGPPRS